MFCMARNKLEQSMLMNDRSLSKFCGKIVLVVNDKTWTMMMKD